MKISIFFLFSFYSSAQDWQKISQHTLKESTSAYAVDARGHIFIGFEDGSLRRYDATGKMLENFSLSNASAITLIDVQNSLKPFLFYFDNQQVLILDRFSATPKVYSISDFDVSFVMMACPAPDGDIWVIENNPQRLKKINIGRKNTILEVQISIGDSIQMMQAYQNLLLISDEQGVHIFDQFGGYVQSIGIKNLRNFQIRNGFIYLISDASISRVNLADLFEAFSEIPLPNKKHKAILKLNSGYLFIENKALSIYDFRDG